jgi:AbiU2
MSVFLDEMFARWQQEWVPKIDHSMLQLWYHREVWQQVRDMLTREHERFEGDGTFLGPFTKMYVDSQAITVRRLADRSPDAVSFARLLNQIHDHPSVVSRERFVRTYRDVGGSGWSDDYGNEDYDRYAGRGRNELDRPWLDRDLQRLLKDAEKVVDYANRTVAHNDRRAFEGQVTFAELAQVVDDVRKLWNKYYLLLTGKSQVEPSIIGDPLAPFRVALD